MKNVSLLFVFIISFVCFNPVMAQDVKDVQQLLQVIKEENISITEAIILIQDAVKNKRQQLSDEIVLSIDYSRAMQEMIAAGKYSWANSNITEKHFPMSTELSGKQISVSAKLFHFNRSISSEDAIAEMNKAGYRPATLVELLTLGEVHPELQKDFPIVALGSVWRDAGDDRDVPALGFDGSERELNLYWFDGDWNDYFRFLAVCK